MRILDRLMGASLDAPSAKATRDTHFLVPYEVVGKTDDGKWIREIVWVDGYWEARTLVARMYRLSSRLLLQAHELVRNAQGAIEFASNGNPVRKYE